MILRSTDDRFRLQNPRIPLNLTVPVSGMKNSGARCPITVDRYTRRENRGHLIKRGKSYVKEIGEQDNAGYLVLIGVRSANDGDPIRVATVGTTPRDQRSGVERRVDQEQTLPGSCSPLR